MKTSLTPEEQAAAELRRQRYAEIAMAADQVVAVILAAAFEQAPEDEDAIVSGAMTAIVRFGIERQQAAAQAWVAQGQIGRTVTVREAMTYFVRYVQAAAEILLGRPQTPSN
jgi:hypothetical protein